MAVLIRVHILHHAEKEPVFGLWFSEELGRHGYKILPGTSYPLVHGLERKGYLRTSLSARVKAAANASGDSAGTKSLDHGAEKVSELFGE
jgi:PadR family transcriptional regulator, regulatory protein PadR